MQNIKNKLIIISGPTGSGKSKLAIECAKKLNTSIISADSMAIYKHMDIGTAKPSIKDMDGVKHYMIDIIEPSQPFSVTDFKNQALPIIYKLQKKGQTPIVCGGTGFYINSLLYKQSFGGVGIDKNIRKYYADLAEKFGNGYVYKMLQEKDMESANSLHPNDLKRVVRALEIFDLSGLKKSEQKDRYESEFDFNAYSINFNREELYERINSRVDEMINLGLVDEVKKLLSMGYEPSSQAMQGIGYKEVVGFLNNAFNHSTMLDIIKQNTRNYAKRQITFFKKLKNLTALSSNLTIEQMSDTVLRDTVLKDL